MLSFFSNLKKKFTPFTFSNKKKKIRKKNLKKKHLKPTNSSKKLEIPLEKELVLNQKEEEIEINEKSPKSPIKNNDSSKEYDYLSEIKHDNHDFICPICLKYIVSATTTHCGHTFCEICLSEYLLFYSVKYLK